MYYQLIACNLLVLARRDSCSLTLNLRSMTNRDILLKHINEHKKRPLGGNDTTQENQQKRVKGDRVALEVL